MRRTRGFMPILATRTGLLLAGLALAAVTACDAGPSATPPAVASPSAGPTASAAAADRTGGGDQADDLKTMVEAAGLNPRQLGVRRATDEETVLRLAVPCRISLRATQRAAHYWAYRDAKIDIVSHSVFGFAPQRGSDVINQVRSTLKMCQTWIYGGTFRMRILGEFRVTRPGGVDNSVAYCHHGTILAGSTKGDRVYLCDGLVSRGSLVSSVGTVQLTLAAAQTELKKALPLAAAALVRAVPAP
jgi:hypothetical protein